MKKSKKESGINIKKEIEKILYLYRLNKVIRHGKKRIEKYQTQSVTEHVANMIYLAYYFRDLEDPKHKFDMDKVIKIILMHDLGEIETGDIITTSKNLSDTKKEEKALKRVVKMTPEFVSKELIKNYTDFEEKISREGQYAKAIDRIEGEFYWFNENGEKMIRDIHGEKNMVKKEFEVYKKDIVLFEKYNFSVIKDFLEYIHADRVKRKIFEF
jgi:putative hydrolase of HD superfamily